MAVYRKPPKCAECGMDIQGKYYRPEVFFAGDTFIAWDYSGHVCRLGTKYFVERTDSNLWWQGQGVWTNNPDAVMIWDTREEAEEYLKTTTEISARLECIITEHEFLNSTN
jgi:hypothetical protein